MAKDVATQYGSYCCIIEGVLYSLIDEYENYYSNDNKQMLIIFRENVIKDISWEKIKKESKTP